MCCLLFVVRSCFLCFCCLCVGRVLLLVVVCCVLTLFWWQCSPLWLCVGYWCSLLVGCLSFVVRCYVLFIVDRCLFLVRCALIVVFLCVDWCLPVVVSCCLLCVFDC